MDRFAREHEFGHIFDAQALTAADRSRFIGLLRLPVATPWNSGTAEDCALRACPSELFADAYATCRLGMRPERHKDGSSGWVIAYGYHPKPKQHRRICSTMAAIGKAVYT